MNNDIIRIANCSGYYGDKLSAAKELVDGGPIDVLTGDYLAELTMGILYSQILQRGSDKGYVATFLKQLKEIAQSCQDKNIKIVVNAGGLNPKSMSQEVQSILDDMNLSSRVAYIDGDDISKDLQALQEQGEKFNNIDRETSLKDSGYKTLTANTYLGAWGIKEALDQNADIVICPRVTDASVVMGPAAWKFNWQRDDYDQLAGALAAGHIIECGAQATGGNYAFFQEVKSFKNIGYPIAEIHEDGSCVITKHKNTGGLVSVGTVTAQLLYEISSTEYLNPDVTGHFNTLKMEQIGDDRVMISGCKGSPPPATHKVCINLAGGYRNGMELILTGLDIEQKAETLTDALFDSLGGKEQFDEVIIDLIRQDKSDPDTHEEAMALLRIIVKSHNTKLVGRVFTAKVVELALANYPGWFSKDSIGSGTPFIVYWPALIDSKYVKELVHIDNKETEVLPTNQLKLADSEKPKVDIIVPDFNDDKTEEIYFGRLIGARSGDKGGCANLGVWVKSEKAYSFLYHFLTVQKLKELLSDLTDYKIERFDFPNLKAVNFYIHGILGDGASSNTKVDALAKSLGEYLRAKKVNVPKELLKEM
ncbi:MAG: acyclic terpene utilization AtuA family protein [Gammaproteobacteria bacterium]